MVVGAIISTLREKDIITVGQGKVNGKKCKFFALTELGKAIFRDMGLE
jgi:DNA-binding PadR family transcriptional regulator